MWKISFAKQFEMEKMMRTDCSLIARVMTIQCYACEQIQFVNLIFKGDN